MVKSGGNEGWESISSGAGRRSPYFDFKRGEKNRALWVEEAPKTERRSFESRVSWGSVKFQGRKRGEMRVET